METTGTQTQATPTTTEAAPKTNAPGSSGPAAHSGQAGKADIGQAGSPQANAVKDAAAEAIRKLKVKVEGKELELPEDEVIRGYSHQKVANKTMQEGLKAKKQAEEFISMMKDKGKLINVLEKIGYKKEDIRKLSEEYLASMLEEEMLDPREKELRDTRNKLKSYEELEKKQKEMEAKKRDDALKAKYAEDYNKQFVDALKTSGLPPTKPLVAEMAKYIYRSAKIGFEMTPSEAAQLVKEDIETAHRSLYGEADAETLARLIGEQGLQKVRTYDTARLRDPNANLKTPKEQGEIHRKRESSSRMSPKEWREFNRK